MKDMEINEFYKKSWNPQESYEEVNKTMNNEWPDWKKRAYNEMFAVSAHAQKLTIKS